MIGICGTCGRAARATGENEGYSDCCNDRIEYGDEARGTVLRVIVEHEDHIRECTKKVNSLSSRICVGRKNGLDVSQLERDRTNENTHKRFAKQDVKILKGYIRRGL